jgi:hypothetical protein
MNSGIKRFHRQHIFFFLLALWFNHSYAQPFATCDKAAPISASISNHFNTSPAPDQLCARKDKKSRYFEQEHNVVWFTFIIPNDTLLNFEIIPDNPTDDIDFLLFKVSKGKSFCDQLNKGTNNPPVRTNVSVSKGTIGLSSNLKVKKGECYYLVVDDKTRQGIIILNMHLNFRGSKQKPNGSIKDNPSYMDANPVKRAHFVAQPDSGNKPENKDTLRQKR